MCKNKISNNSNNLYKKDNLQNNTRDEVDNLESKVDVNEDIKLGCIMVSEIFGPNEIDSLYRGLRNLHWDRDILLDSNDRSNIIEWIDNGRMYGSEGVFSLGWVHRAGDLKKLVGVRYVAEYPDEFSCLLVSISQITPSVTCLTVGFVLSSEASLEYKSELNRPAKTTRRQRQGGVYSIMGVQHIKSERIDVVRKKYIDLGTSWVSNNFRGFFGKRNSISHFPTVEFLQIDGFSPFENKSDINRPWMHWASLVNIGYKFDVWTCTSVPSLKFSLDYEWGRKLRNHMIVALRWDDLKKEDREHYSSEELSSKFYFAYERIDGIIVKYALLIYIKELIRYIKETRQSLPNNSIFIGSASEVRIITQFFRRSIGVPSIAREGLVLSENNASFRWNATGFTQKIRPDRDETCEIADALKLSIGSLSRQLLDEDRDTREFLNQLSSATGIKESISAQRRMEFIGIASIIVAVISIVFLLSK